jgi:hypothetical protein
MVRRYHDAGDRAVEMGKELIEGGEAGQALV